MDLADRIPQISPLALLGDGVTIGDSSVIDAFAVVGRVPLRGYTARDPGQPQPTRIGAGCRVGCHTVIYAGAWIGARVLVGDGVLIREGAIIGDDVRLHWDTQINYLARIGVGTIIGGGCHITGGMVVGGRCFFGAGVMSANDPDPTRGYDADRLAAPIVGNGVLIGAGAVLLPGCRIGDGARIGAGAIVDGDVPAGAAVAGVRGRRVAGAYQPTWMGATTPPEPVFSTEERPASMGVCARCHQPLDNVAPGFSIVAGGAMVCTVCLRPGEEIARARGLT